VLAVDAFEASNDAGSESVVEIDFKKGGVVLPEG
jgi:hypothetical protein